MCGIFGVLYKNRSRWQHKKLEDRLFISSQSRGTEASGFFSLNKNKIIMYKAPIRGKEFINTHEYKSVLNSDPKIQLFVGHSRLATNGATGDNHNNQPILKNNVLCVHNGIIINANTLWDKHRPKLKEEYEVDSEIIPALYNYYIGLKNDPIASISKVYSEIRGAASVGLFPTNSDYILLATNTGSLYYTFTDKILVFASEKFILQKAIGGNHIIQCKPGHGIYININSLNLVNFDLDKPNKIFISNLKYDKREVVDLSYYPKNINFSRLLNNISLLKTHQPDYKAISAIRRCAKCIMPETMPLIAFDDRGVCNFCRTYEKQKPLGLTKLNDLIGSYRSKNGEPDCIVALSGGRDSSYGLHYAKNVLRLNPIAYTYDWGMVTDVARKNQSRITAALGVEHIIVSADINKKRKNIRKNVLAWLSKPDVAMVPLFMAGDKQAEYYAEELKRKTGIKLIIYCRGNQLEDERFKFGYFGIFDGTPKGVIHNLSANGKIKMAGYFLKACLRNPKYINSSLFDTAWAYASSYLMPHKNFVYLWHYIPWKEESIVSALKKQYGWETATDTVATWRIDDGTPPFYNYIYYHFQGFTEHDGLRSNQIREGVITRQKALELVTEENKPRYESLAWYFDAIGIDGKDTLRIIDRIPSIYQK